MATLPEIQVRFAAAFRSDAGAMRPESIGDAGSILSEVIVDGLAPDARLRIYRNNSRTMFEAGLVTGCAAPGMEPGA